MAKNFGQSTGEYFQEPSFSRIFWEIRNSDIPRIDDSTLDKEPEDDDLDSETYNKYCNSSERCFGWDLVSELFGKGGLAHEAAP